MRALLLAALVLAACANDDQVYPCTHRDMCSIGTMRGMCEDTGFCSLPDPTCASLRRYVDHAPPELAGQCVPTGADARIPGLDAAP